MKKLDNKISNAIHMLSMTAIVFVVLVLANVLIDRITNRVDISVYNIYSLSDVTKEVLNDLEKEVTIYIIADGPSNESITISQVANEYAKYSDKIKIERIKPTLDYKFLAEHNVNVSMGSLVVECDGKSKGLEATNLISNIADTDDSAEYDRYLVDVEGQLTSAIAYVTENKSPKAYVLSGNDKDSISVDMADYITKQNIEIGILDITKEKAIPEDASILIYIPHSEDLTEEEYNLIRDFLENGGSMFVATYYNNSTTDDFVNFNNLMKHYGISLPGYKVIETNTNNYYESDKPYIIKPNYEEHEITENLISESRSLMIMGADRIVIDDVPDTVTVTEVLTSSDRAYAKKSDDKITQKLDNDPVGPFNIAVAITDEISDGVESRIFVISSSSIVEDTYDESVAGGNSELVINAMQWLAKQEKKVSVSKKWMQLSNLVITLKSAKTVLYIAVIIIPAAILLYGGYVWFRRRRR